MMIGRDGFEGRLQESDLQPAKARDLPLTCRPDELPMKPASGKALFLASPGACPAAAGQIGVV